MRLVQLFAGEVDDQAVKSFFFRQFREFVEV